ncbi:LLM class flavin-dependent oxidoreductase [Bradyrhizobium valentinum]|uniref:LLM class flavin-dependent oxidoreductase n=1 Tax=Bradyrhizobium valentinum TaxID=1518501 RepID=UPI0023EA654B|nr:LLM class flavin-dependent oxidoreductase [Bradyrhizobium valentinum]
MSSVAQRTRQLRIGPLVMLLNLYHPLRAFEEICTLDHLSGGRLEVGIGRGSLPLELGYYGISADAAPSRYEEASEILISAMKGGMLSYQGQHFELNSVPLTVKLISVQGRRHGLRQIDPSPQLGQLPMAQISRA